MTESDDHSLQIRFFAGLREDIGLADMALPLNASDMLTVEDVRRALIDQGPAFQALGNTRVHCAVNQAITGLDARVTAGDEVAFFPPVTGG